MSDKITLRIASEVIKEAFNNYENVVEARLSESDINLNGTIVQRTRIEIITRKEEAEENTLSSIAKNARLKFKSGFNSIKSISDYE